MSEERKTKTDAAAPASAALERIDRKDAFLQALHTFLTAHQGTEWAVAAVDIQHFKLYNELYGTEKGDALLETVANCLLGYSRQTGYPVGYFGNDDFFLCLPDEKAEQTAVLATLQACMAAGRQDVTFFMVMGVCPVQANPGADAATLCNYAQIAGVTTDSGYLHRFEPTMLNELKEQQQLGELEHALDNHEFCFFLQPKCNSITRAIVGMEALVRWNHPTRGCVPPAEFMPLLERTGLVTRLDQYIWESVCQTLQKWQESGSNLVPVSVNVSVVDIVNLVSIRSGYSIGGFDADKIVGGLELGVGKEGEIYHGIGRGELNIAGLPVYRDGVAGVGTPTSDEERTKIEMSTTSLLMILNGYSGKEGLLEAGGYSVDLLKRYVSAVNVEAELICRENRGKITL